MTRVFLVDDHTVLRKGLRSLLDGQPNITVVGEAANGQELLDQLHATPADVVLLDLHMPVLDGLTTTRRLREEFSDVRVLILSMEEHELSIDQVLKAGALGYVLKNADKAEILVAIQSVAAGKRFLCSELGLLMLDKLVGTPLVSPELAQTDKALSQREREVLQLIADGLTNVEISDKLFTSKRTIETHRQNILEKTGAKNTAALVRYAMGRGWLSKE
ncbi:response regulator [Hymenobacter sp. B1770]|uniref:response regulator n=1 Tax=Hymenobacter sp. B1770 TaxID=1718788 RepID=UPI003CF80F65